jgi:uncharacterized protein (DUF58 family)
MLTRRGAAAAVIAVAAYVLALFLHYPELAVMAVGSTAALLFGLGWVVRRPNISVERTLEPNRVTRGESAAGLLTVQNTGHVAVGPMVGQEHCGEETVLLALPRLAPGAAIDMSYPLPTQRRAVLVVGPVSIARKDPFGLWRAAQQVSGTERLWVHPIHHPLALLPRGRKRSIDGPDQDAFPHGTITFQALREYVPGDDLRHVHWRTSARTGTLMVREQVDTSLAQVSVVLDASDSSYSLDEFESAVEVVASIALAATRARLAVRVIVTSGESAQGRGESTDSAAILDLLAGVRRTSRGSLTDVASQLAVGPRGDLLMVVTGAASTDELPAIGALGERFSRGMITIVSADPGEGQVSVPPHLSVIRVKRASEFSTQWEQQLIR